MRSGRATTAQLATLPRRFSLITGREGKGRFAGLHPLRLAWCWAVQNAAAEAREIIEDAASLLRFIDGGDLPMFGPWPGI